MTKTLLIPGEGRIGISTLKIKLKKGMWQSTIRRMKHADFKLKLTRSHGYTYPSQAYNTDFQIIYKELKKNL